MAMTTYNVRSVEKQVSSYVNVYLVKDVLRMSLRPIERINVMGDGADMALDYAENTWFEAENSYGMSLAEKYDRGLCDEYGFEPHHGRFATNSSIEKIKTRRANCRSKNSDMSKRIKRSIMPEQNKKSKQDDGKLICQYCKTETEKVSGKVIYPHLEKLHNGLYYLCKKCGAYVGAHIKTGLPMGDVADDKLRAARIKAHISLDEIWQDCIMDRTDTYRWLAVKMGLSKNECHIGKFNIEQCRRVVDICSERKQKNK